MGWEDEMTGEWHPGPKPGEAPMRPRRIRILVSSDDGHFDTQTPEFEFIASDKDFQSWHIRAERQQRDDQAKADQRRRDSQPPPIFDGDPFAGVNWEDLINNMRGFNGSFRFFADSFFSDTGTAPPRTEYKKTSQSKSGKARLMEIAGEADQSIDTRKLLRRAQRKAHPDTGGSHELWLEVDQIRVRLGL